MAGSVDDIVLEHLRHIRDRMDAMAEDMQSLEIGRLKLRVARIERRLDLSEPPP